MKNDPQHWINFYTKLYSHPLLINMIGLQVLITLIYLEEKECDRKEISKRLFTSNKEEMYKLLTICGQNLAKQINTNLTDTLLQYIDNDKTAINEAKIWTDMLIKHGAKSVMAELLGIIYKILTGFSKQNTDPFIVLFTNKYLVRNFNEKSLYSEFTNDKYSEEFNKYIDSSIIADLYKQAFELVENFNGVTDIELNAQIQSFGFSPVSLLLIEEVMRDILAFFDTELLD